MLTRFAMYGMPRPLMMEGAEDGKGAGGGGGGDGKGGGAGGGLTEEVKKFVTDTVNAANAAWAKRIEGKIPTVDTLREGLKLEETIGAAFAKLKGEGAGGGGGGGADDGKGGGQGGPDPETKKLLLKMEEDNKALRDRIAKQDAESTKEREARARSEERTALQAALVKAGVRAELLPAAIALLHGDEKRLKRSKNGDIVWPVKRGTGDSAYDDDLTIEAGLTEWLATDQGKAYLPPKDAGGGGGAGGGRPPNPGEKPNVAQARQTVVDWLSRG